MNGTSGVFTFPFRIHGASDLAEAAFATRETRVRIHPPATLRGTGPVISPDYPPRQWPAFRWSPWIGRKDKALPPTAAPARQSLGPATYDGFRADYWADQDPEPRLLDFVRRFLAWLRLGAGQDWIGRYEIHTDLHRKYGFSIDSNGRTIDAPYAYGVARIGQRWIRPVDQASWESCAKEAFLGREVAEYWVLFQDAGVSLVEGDLRGAVLRLALSLEVGRNVHFSPYCEAEDDPVLGPRLGPPFEGTNLLKHLSSRLASVHPTQANAESDLAEDWPQIHQLYIARHHVAHGRPPVSKFSEGMRALTDDDLKAFTLAVFNTLKWMETLSESS